MSDSLRFVVSKEHAGNKIAIRLDQIEMMRETYDENRVPILEVWILSKGMRALYEETISSFVEKAMKC